VPVRRACLEGLITIYGDEDHIEPLQQFTERFLPRMQEMSSDVDEGVALSSVKLITLFLKWALLLPPPPPPLAATRLCCG
jgi:hypothetical protein